MYKSFKSKLQAALVIAFGTLLVLAIIVVPIFIRYSINKERFPNESTWMHFFR